MPETTRFAALLECYEREIYRFVFRLTGNPEDAADLLQDTFLKAFKAFARLPVDANHRAWLYRIAHNEALNLFRSRTVRATVPLELAASVAGGTEDDPDSLEETRRLARALGDVIRKLTPRQRSALLLKKYEGLSYGEVASVLRCSEENARAQVYQAMKKIRNGLKQERR